MGVEPCFKVINLVFDAISKSLTPTWPTLLQQELSTSPTHACVLSRTSLIGSRSQNTFRFNYMVYLWTTTLGGYLLLVLSVIVLGDLLLGVSLGLFAVKEIQSLCFNTANTSKLTPLDLLITPWPCLSTYSLSASAAAKPARSSLAKAWLAGRPSRLHLSSQALTASKEAKRKTSVSF